MPNKGYIKEYAILGRYRKDTKFHPIAGDPQGRITDKSEAESILLALKEKAKKEIEGKVSTVRQAGFLAISIPHDTDYDVVEFRLIEREVSDWITVEQVNTIDYTTEGDRDVEGMRENGATVLWATEPETSTEDVHQMLEYATGKYLLTLRRLQDGCLHVVRIQKVSRI